MKEVKPTRGEIRAATIICTAYRKLVEAAGLIDDLNMLPKEIKAVAKIIATNR